MIRNIYGVIYNIDVNNSYKAFEQKKNYDAKSHKTLELSMIVGSGNKLTERKKYENVNFNSDKKINYSSLNDK